MNRKIGTSIIEACPHCGSFMVVAAPHQVSASANPSEDAELTSGQPSTTLLPSKNKFNKAKKLRCVDCGTRFRQSPSSSYSWFSPTSVLMLVLLVLSALALFQFSGVLDGIGRDPLAEQGEQVSGNSAQGASENQGLEVTAEQEMTSQAEPDSNLESSQLENMGYTEPRATGLYDRKEDVVQPSPSDLEQLEHELAEQTAASQLKIERVEQTLSQAEQEERVALMRLAVSQALEAWRSAWERGDFTAYLNAYAEDFTPTDDMSHKAWRSQRELRVTQGLPRKITLTNFDTRCELASAKCVIEFDQFFEAPHFSDMTRKRLELASMTVRSDSSASTSLSASADYKIIAETSLVD